MGVKVEFFRCFSHFNHANGSQKFKKRERKGKKKEPQKQVTLVKRETRHPIGKKRNLASMGV